MENYLALVAIILKVVCGSASLEGAFRCSKIKQARSTKKKSRFVHLFRGWGSL
ncbi:ABC transporter permease [Enterococcus faecium]|nr:ABC transporter permease [Enterococcus faecium]MBL4993882.1 ABC transporter permease [Enterococcus lactis]